MSDEKKEKQVSFFERESIRENTDIITDMLDKQAIENIRTLQKKRNYEEEIIAALHKLNTHSLCPGALPTCEDLKKNVMKEEAVKEGAKEIVHGDDCHCSKCCPNPNPTWLQKNKNSILISVLVMAMLILAIGWSPAGATFDAIQTSYVDLIVNFFKMAILAVAGISIYKLTQKKND